MTTQQQIWDLAERMGSEATFEDATRLAELMESEGLDVVRFMHEGSGYISEDAWLTLVDRSCAIGR